jgi:SAM-dependent methyltransferase
LGDIPLVISLLGLRGQKTVSIVEEAVSSQLRTVGEVDELSFWRDTCNSERFVNSFCKETPNPEFNIDVAIFLRSLASEVNKNGEVLSILDVGSGPVSMLSRSFVDQQVQLIAVDPLADKYYNLWDNPYKHEVVLPIACDGEKLSEKFGKERFDVIHIRNALDHVIHPIAVIEEMIKTTKHGGHIVIHGFENEADRMQWTGFHQWNLKVEKDDLIIDGKRGAHYSMRDQFKNSLRVVRSWRTTLANYPWFGVIAQVL